MERFIALVAGSLVPWGAWLFLGLYGVVVEFDGLAFLFVATSSWQLIVLANRNRDCDAFRTLLALQVLINVLFLVGVAVSLRTEVLRPMLMCVTAGQLVIAYTTAFKRRRAQR